MYWQHIFGSFKNMTIRITSFPYYIRIAIIFIYMCNVHLSYNHYYHDIIYVYTPTRRRDLCKLFNSSNKYHHVNTSYIVIKFGSVLVTSEKFGWQHFIVTEKRSSRSFTPQPRVDPKKKQISPHRTRPAYTYYECLIMWIK